MVIYHKSVLRALPLLSIKFFNLEALLCEPLRKKQGGPIPSPMVAIVQAQFLPVGLGVEQTRQISRPLFVGIKFFTEFSESRLGCCPDFHYCVRILQTYVDYPIEPFTGYVFQLFLRDCAFGCVCCFTHCSELQSWFADCAPSLHCYGIFNWLWFGSSRLSSSVKLWHRWYWVSLLLVVDDRLAEELRYTVPFTEESSRP